MLQNAKVTAFTVSELLRENQQGGRGGPGGKSPLPHPDQDKRLGKVSEYIKILTFAGDSDEFQKKLTQTIVDKNYEKMLRNRAKLDRTKKLSYLFLRHFLLLVPKLYFWKGDSVLRFAFMQVMENIVYIDTAGNVIQISGIYLISAQHFSFFLMQIEKFNSKMLILASFCYPFNA